MDFTKKKIILLLTIYREILSTTRVFNCFRSISGIDCENDKCFRERACAMHIYNN